MSRSRPLLSRLVRGAALAAAVAGALLGAITPLRAAWDFDRLQRSIVQHFGAPAAKALQDWRDTLTTARGLTETDKLERINTFFNRRVDFQDDTAVWKQVDYWATPLETLGKGAGDCEDFTIAKYFSLKELGVPIQKLRLIYVKARIGGPNSSISQAHMVLGYYATPDAEPLVLDNLISDIRPASRRPDLVPVFSFNSDGIWAGGSSAPAGSVDRLTRWKDLTLRMQGEGFD